VEKKIEFKKQQKAIKTAEKRHQTPYVAHHFSFNQNKKKTRDLMINFSFNLNFF